MDAAASGRDEPLAQRLGIASALLRVERGVDQTPGGIAGEGDRHGREHGLAGSAAEIGERLAGTLAPAEAERQPGDEQVHDPAGDEARPRQQQEGRAASAGAPTQPPEPAAVQTRVALASPAVGLPSESCAGMNRALDVSSRHVAESSSAAPLDCTTVHPVTRPLAATARRTLTGPGEGPPTRLVG